MTGLILMGVVAIGFVSIANVQACRQNKEIAKLKQVIEELSK